MTVKHSFITLKMPFRHAKAMLFAPEKARLGTEKAHFNQKKRDFRSILDRIGGEKSRA